MIPRIFVLSLMFLTAHAHTTEYRELFAFRGADGEYTRASVQNFRQMARIAKAEGSIDVWVTFAMDFTGTPELRTPEVVEQEATTKQRMINAVVVPLGRRAQLLETPPGFAEAPGCLVRATAQGLRQIAASEDVKHISWYAPQ